MRKLGLIVTAGLLIALLAAAVLGLSLRQIGAGYFVGAAWMVVVSIIMNTASSRAGDPFEYGEETAWMGAGSMDGFDYHADHMPAATGAGHAETYVSFPGNNL